MTPRFTISNNQPDLNGWAIGITDHETNEPFDSTTYEVHSESITDTKEELEDLCLLLNQMDTEIKHIKNTIRDMMETERTQIGQNTLKQLWEAIQ